MGSHVFEQPVQVGLDIDTTLLGRPDNSEENDPPMGASDAAGKQERIPQVRVPLERSLRFVSSPVGRSAPGLNRQDPAIYSRVSPLHSKALSLKYAFELLSFNRQLEARLSIQPADPSAGTAHGSARVKAPEAGANWKRHFRLLPLAHPSTVSRSTFRARQWPNSASHLIGKPHLHLLGTGRRDVDEVESTSGLRLCRASSNSSLLRPTRSLFGLLLSPLLCAAIPLLHAHSRSTLPSISPTILSFQAHEINSARRGRGSFKSSRERQCSAEWSAQWHRKLSKAQVS